MLKKVTAADLAILKASVESFKYWKLTTEKKVFNTLIPLASICFKFMCKPWINFGARHSILQPSG